MNNSETTATQRQKITPKKLAEFWGCSYQKILTLIETGQLAAVDTAIDPDGKIPRYMVDVQDVAAFEKQRSNRRGRTISL